MTIRTWYPSVAKNAAIDRTGRRLSAAIEFTVGTMTVFTASGSGAVAAPDHRKSIDANSGTSEQIERLLLVIVSAGGWLSGAAIAFNTHDSLQVNFKNMMAVGILRKMRQSRLKEIAFS
jgi:hypothetical protein